MTKSWFRWPACVVLVATFGNLGAARAADPLVEDGKFQLRFHYQYFPTSGEVAALQNEVERARAQLCDATDGAIKIGGVTLSYGAASAEDGDVWLLPIQGRSHANLLQGHVTMFLEGTGYSGNTLPTS